MGVTVRHDPIVTTQPTAVRVFISYSRADQSTVLPIAERLQDHGFIVFLDTHNIPGGATWQLEIEAALEASQCCVVCVGAAGIGKWHSDEIQLARVIEKRKAGFVLVPVLLPGASDESIRGFLEIYNIIDLRGIEQDKDAFEALVNALCIVHDHPQAPTTLLPHEVPNMMLPVTARHGIGCTMRIVLVCALLVSLAGIGMQYWRHQMPASIATPIKPLPQRSMAELTKSVDRYDQWSPTGCRLGATIYPVEWPDQIIRLHAYQNTTLHWTIQNTGTCIWTGDYIAQFVGMTDASVPNTVTVPSNHLAVGAVVTVSVQLIAPAQQGTYVVFGRLRSQDDIVFGQPLTYTVQVVTRQTRN